MEFLENIQKKKKKKNEHSEFTALKSCIKIKPQRDITSHLSERLLEKEHK